MSLKGFTSSKFYNVWANADARNPKKTSNKSEWVDAEGKPLGNRAVYLRVIILFFLLCKPFYYDNWSHSKWKYGQPLASSTTAFLSHTGFVVASIANGLENYPQTTLCVQEILTAATTKTGTSTINSKELSKLVFDVKSCEIRTKFSSFEQIK